MKNAKRYIDINRDIKNPKFKNKKLQVDLKALISNDSWSFTDITEDYISENEVFVLDIKDKSYFYKLAEDRNFDDNLIMEVLRSKLGW